MSSNITITTGKPAEVELRTVKGGGVTFDIAGGGGAEYNGSYSITPSEESQVLRTANRRCTQNITVEPIPSNYGRIEWNGTTLTVY